MLYDQSNDRDLAIERYRRALDAQPAYVRGEVVEISNSAGLMEVRPLALNNLAYDLAVYRHAPAEALPYAQKALAYGPNDPELLDTVAWVEHLLGDDKSAIGHPRTAVARAPANSTVWHAGVVAAAVDAIPEAENYLNMALQLNPSLETSDEVVALRTRFPSCRRPSIALIARLIAAASR
jgi:tetratricopeptide (TPR) repeat protein